MIVNQWIPAAHAGDAVGDNARLMRDLFRRWGHDAEIYATMVDDELAGDVRLWTDPASHDGDVTIYHFAVPSPMTASFSRLPGARVLHYHNVTPAHFFARWDAGLWKMATRGREELASLAPRTELALGVSEFNRRELDALGFARTGVLPIVVDVERLQSAPRVRSIDALLQDEFVNILFVGRIAPNKMIEDHIRLAEVYKRYVDAHYRFIFVGRCDAVPGYYAAIQDFISGWRMLPERFIFTGAVPDDELATYYRNAHAYVSLSEHEGFGVPLVEAMGMDVPVLAYGAAAVPETLGGAGVMFNPKDLEMAAELLGTLIYDEPFRQGVLAGQRRRAAEFGRPRIEQQVREALAAVA